MYLVKEEKPEQLSQATEIWVEHPWNCYLIPNRDKRFSFEARPPSCSIGNRGAFFSGKATRI
jgi:hypothetical protein